MAVAIISLLIFFFLISFYL